jgi:hypothetical protein
MEAGFFQYVDVHPAPFHIVRVFVWVQVTLLCFGSLRPVYETFTGIYVALEANEAVVHAQVVVWTQVIVAYEVELHVEVVGTVSVTVYLPLPLFVTHVILDGRMTVKILVHVTVGTLLVAGMVVLFSVVHGSQYVRLLADEVALTAPVFQGFQYVTELVANVVVLDFMFQGFQYVRELIDDVLRYFSEVVELVTSGVVLWMALYFVVDTVDVV